MASPQVKCDSALSAADTILVQPAPPVVDSAFTCANGILTLTATGVPTGATVSWTGPCIGVVSGDFYIINPATSGCSGTYCATVTLGGCTSTAGCGYATVEPIPWATLTGPSGCVAPGVYTYTVNFSPIGSTFTYSENGYTYTVTPTSSPFTFTDTVTTTSVIASLYNIWHIWRIGNPSVTCDSFINISDTLSPKPPTPIVDSAFACKNGILTMKATGIAAGASISWTGPCVGTVSGDSYIINPATSGCSGTYCATVTVGTCTSTAGCGYGTVEAIPWATLSGPSGCVAPGSYTFTITYSPPGSTILYRINGVPHAVPVTATSPYTIPVTLGTIPITVTIVSITHDWGVAPGTKCDSTILDSLTIYPEVCPVITNFVVVGHNATFLPSGGTPCTFDGHLTVVPSPSPCYTAHYKWVMTDGGSVFSTTLTTVDSVMGIPFVLSGTGTLQVFAYFVNSAGDTCYSNSNIDSFGCQQGNESLFRPMESMTQLNNGSDYDVRLVPNPNKGVFNIIGTLSTSNMNTTTVEVLNAVGQIVYKEDASLENGIINKEVILNNNLANGIYLLRVSGDAGYKVIRFVLDR